MSMVPAIERTDPDPTPSRRTASRARSRSFGCVVSPIDDLTMVEGRFVALLAFEDAELAVQALLLERFELAPEKLQRIVTRHGLSVSSRQSSVISPQSLVIGPQSSVGSPQSVHGTHSTVPCNVATGKSSVYDCGRSVSD